MKKDNNNITIFLIGIIIVLLATFLILILTNKITFNTNNLKEEKREKIDEKQDNEEKEIYEITFEEEEYITKKSDGTEVSKSTRNIPKITNNKNQEAADKIVKYLTDISNKEWNDSIKKMADQVTDDNVPYKDLGVKYLYETGVTTENRLTFILTMNGGFGGVGWLSEEGYNFDAKTGDVLTTDTIAINKDEFKKYMLRKTNEKIEELKKGENNCIRDDYQNNLEEEINRNGNWYFTKTEIKIKLQKYSIACGAGGISEINLPKEEVNQYLKDEYKIID